MAAVAFSAAPSFAADSGCDAIAKTIDQAQRRIGLASAHQTAATDRERERWDRDIMVQLAVINANISLAAANKCPPPKDPVAVPGVYSKAAAACGSAMLKARREAPTGHAEPECVITEWKADNVQ